jgi:predicted cobalt transporter CbtA
MILRVLKAALVAGFLAACVAATLQTFLTSPLILQAETYEKAAVPETHASGYGSLLHLAHEHHAPADASEGSAWEPGEGLPRIAFTALATLVSGVGYASLLAALILAVGRELDPQTALRWAIGGFLAVNLAPAVGLYLITNVRHLAAIGIGLIAIVLPHLIGAPHAEAASSGVPAVLAAQFAARSLAIAFAFWTTLGLGLGWYWTRQEDRTKSGLLSQAAPVTGERKAV